MKLFIAILLTSTVLISECINVFDMVKLKDHHLETSYEGEVEKEVSENLEDVVKIKFETPTFSDCNEINGQKDSRFGWIISIPYMEIHSPPPELSSIILR